MGTLNGFAPCDVREVVLDACIFAMVVAAANQPQSGALQLKRMRPFPSTVVQPLQSSPWLRDMAHMHPVRSRQKDLDKMVTGTQLSTSLQCLFSTRLNSKKVGSRWC